MTKLNYAGRYVNELHTILRRAMRSTIRLLRSLPYFLRNNHLITPLLRMVR